MKIQPADAELAEALWSNLPPAPSREIQCRHCGQPNEVPLSAALFDTGSCECGACSKPLFIGRDEPLSGLGSTTYQHSLDEKSSAALTSLPGFKRATKWLLKHTVERGFRVQLMASAVRCDEAQFPELLSLLDQARLRLGFASRPTLFLSESPDANAFTTGGHEHVVVIFSGLLDLVDDRHLLAIIGHELGHIQAEHVANRMLAFMLSTGVSAASGFAGLGQIITLPLSKALMQWSRCAELTADRAALLASRDLRSSVEMFLNFAGGNRAGVKRRTTLTIAPFIKQARDLATMESANALDGVASLLLTMDQSHPFPAWRLMHLLQWAEKGSYLDILAGNYRRAPADQASPA